MSCPNDLSRAPLSIEKVRFVFHIEEQPALNLAEGAAIRATSHGPISPSGWRVQRTITGGEANVRAEKSPAYFSYPANTTPNRCSKIHLPIFEIPVTGRK